LGEENEKIFTDWLWLVFLLFLLKLLILNKIFIAFNSLIILKLLTINYSPSLRSNEVT